MRLVFVLLVSVLFVVGAWSDELPDGPKPKMPDHHFFFAVGVLAAAKTADAISTERMLGRGCYENNPVYGRYPSPARLGWTEAAFFAGDVAAAYFLKRHFVNRRGFLRHVWMLPLLSETATNVDFALHNEGLRCR